MRRANNFVAKTLDEQKLMFLLESEFHKNPQTASEEHEAEEFFKPSTKPTSTMGVFAAGEVGESMPGSGSGEFTLADAAEMGIPEYLFPHIWTADAANLNFYRITEATSWAVSQMLESESVASRLGLEGPTLPSQPANKSAKQPANETAADRAAGRETITIGRQY